MSAEDLIKTGDLSGAGEALRAEIRANPSDAKLRIFLFQLLCIEGDWQRAVQQLKVSASLDPAAVTMAQMYREAIICEKYRARVFAGQAEPVFHSEEHTWLSVMFDALHKQAGGDLEGAERLRAMALKAAPATPGNINGTPFDWITDADPRLGPVLEIIVNGKYIWMPFADIAALTAEPPRDLRDLVWMPVTLKLIDGTETVGLVPTRYPCETSTQAHKLARATDWIQEDGRVIAGLGQRMFCTEAEDIALLDLRALDMHAAPKVARSAARSGSAHG